jgi:hypothetical protein
MTELTIRFGLVTMVLHVIIAIKKKAFIIQAYFGGEITVGKGNKIIAKKVGSMRCTVQQKNGEKSVVVLKNVKFVPEIWLNLFIT